MMASGGSSGGGKGTKKYGRNLTTCQRYKNANRRYKNKLKRVRQSSGEKAARKYEKYFLLNGTTKGVKF